MNRELANKIANTVLYEGYMLYPYRRSAIKNRQRWTFGILYPPAYPEVLGGTERSSMHSECLLQTEDGAVVQVELRFLHLLARETAQFVDGKPETVASFMVDGRAIESWDEGVERSVQVQFSTEDTSLHRSSFSFPGGITSTSICDSQGRAVGLVTQVQHEVSGTVSMSIEPAGEKVLKLTFDVSNTTTLPPHANDRNSAMLRSLLSAHTILTATRGAFVSLLDPPECLIEPARGCNNVANFPVLVGEPDEHDMMLCSPIVLYDYPRIAPESAGDFFDGTEMDEMLTLRVMTLSDNEKDEMRGGDDRVRALLQRTEQSAHEQLMRTHGTIRSMRPVSEP